jgi:hypothetical protein
MRSGAVKVTDALQIAVLKNLEAEQGGKPRAAPESSATPRGARPSDQRGSSSPDTKIIP